MYKVTGNTYNAKDFLKDAGFKWDAKAKCWMGDEEANENFLKGKNGTYYGRKINSLLHKFNINVEKIDIDTLA